VVRKAGSTVHRAALPVKSWTPGALGPIDRAVVARVGHRLERPDGALKAPVSVGGVIVNPGDLVVADDNGIVVPSAARAEELYPIPRAAEDRPPFVRRWLEAGGDLAELAGLDAQAVEALLRERGW
jgi:regulator of RNase E activity RraA